jgi:hypothetical protein
MLGSTPLGALTMTFDGAEPRWNPRPPSPLVFSPPPAIATAATSGSGRFCCCSSDGPGAGTTSGGDGGAAECVGECDNAAPLSSYTVVVATDAVVVVAAGVVAPRNATTKLHPLALARGSEAEVSWSNVAEFKLSSRQFAPSTKLLPEKPVLAPPGGHALSSCVGGRHAPACGVE